MNNKEKIAFVLFGSPHKNGNTNKMLEMFKEYVKGYKFVYINSYDSKTKPCIDCKVCVTSTHCKYDDFEFIDTLLHQSDLLIVASPIYNLSFPSPLKAIFDRMQIYFSARFSRNVNPPIKKLKKVVVLATCGSNDDLGMKIINYQLKMICSIINANIVKTVLWKNTDKDKNICNVKKEIMLAASLL